MVANDKLRAHSNLPLMKIICPFDQRREETPKAVGVKSGGNQELPLGFSYCQPHRGLVYLVLHQELLLKPYRKN